MLTKRIGSDNITERSRERRTNLENDTEKERSAINKTVIPKSELEDQETDLRDKGLNGRV